MQFALYEINHLKKGKTTTAVICTHTIKINIIQNLLKIFVVGITTQNIYLWLYFKLNLHI